MKFKSQNEKGFTITELLSAVALLSIILIGIYGLFGGGQTQALLGEKRVIAQGNARQAMLKVCSELRECYSIENTTTPTSLLTNDWTLSFRGLQYSREQLTPVGSDYKIYDSLYDPWEATTVAQPVVYLNSGVYTGGFSIDANNGQVVFAYSLLSSDIVEASYTWKVYVQYQLNNNRQIIRRLFNMNGTQIGTDGVVVSNVVNKLLSPQVSFITRSSNYVTIKILVDDDLNKPPATFRLESSIKARV